MILVLLCLLTFLRLGLAARILLLPVAHHSHVSLLASTGKALAEDGHNVSILTNARHGELVRGSGLRVLLLESCHRGLLPDDYGRFEDVMMKDEVDSWTMAVNFTQTMVEMTDRILSSDHLMDELRGLQLDLAFVDGSPAGHSLYAIPYKLGLRYMTISAYHLPWKAGIPVLPSVEPPQFTYSNHDLSFAEKLQRLMDYINLNSIPGRLAAFGDQLIRKHFPNSGIGSVEELYDRSEMWFVNVDTICLDPPRLAAPHYHFVGGLGVEAVKELPVDFRDFVENAASGVAVVSFGSAIRRLPRAIIGKVLSALGRLDQKVIVKSEGTTYGAIPENVLIRPWIPQNDLVGHQNTRVLVTHGGQNSLLEALYHGVPMVTLPFVADQHNNARKVKDKGYGETIDPRSFREEDLYRALKQVIDDVSYSTRVKTCSNMLRQFHHPKETVKFWTRYILQFGSDHLKPSSLNMSPWRLFMMDVTVPLLVALNIAVSVLILVIYRGCCSSSGSRKEKRS